MGVAFLFALFIIVGLLLFLGSIVWLIVHLFRKKPLKKPGLSLLIGVVLFIIGGIMAPPADVEDAANKDNAVSETAMKNEDEEESVVEENEESEDKDEIKDTNEPDKQESDNSLLAVYAQDFIPLVTDGNLYMSNETYDFIRENAELFPARDEESQKKVKEMTDTSITIKHLNKDVSPYLTTIVTFEGGVISIESQKLEDDITVSVLHVMDDNFDSYQVLTFGDTEDIFDDDYVRFWGVPVGPSYFPNVSGGITNVQVIYGAHIEKQ